MTLVVFAGIALLGVVALGLIVVVGTRMVRNPDESSGSMADAFGSFIDVFDPARARADRDLDSKEHQGEAAPSPDDDDRPVTVDLRSGTARIRRTPPRT
ncbi:hypothetical protein [Nocardioides terrae]|uniref:hypothetical protein n=1 Tax=Nocardioides terrae TaxID=574651 RepID=UPI0011143D66|nr:hypothetical protein [Nocardioides terrae]